MDPTSTNAVHMPRCAAMSVSAPHTISTEPGALDNRPLTGLLRADDVYTQVKLKAKDAMLVAIEQEREGEQIDRSLLKNVLGIFIEVGMGTMDAYNLDFEQHLLSTTAEYYKKKAASWIAVSISTRTLAFAYWLVKCAHLPQQRVTRLELICYPCLSVVAGC